MSNKHADSVDILIGERLRALRNERSLSQTKVAVALGVTFQQVQKYEKGFNRISPGKLVKLADLLDVEVAHLFDGAQSATQARKTRGDACLVLSQSRDGVRLARAFNNIKVRSLRDCLISMAEAIAKIKNENAGATARESTV